MKKRLASCFLSLVLALSLLPMNVLAGEGDPVDLSSTETFTFTKNCTLTGTVDRQIILDGTDAPITITLLGVNVHGNNASNMTSGIKVQGKVTLLLEGASTVTGGDGSRTGCAAIEVAPNATLIIEGPGTLTALAGAGKQDVTGSQEYTKWARGGDAIGGNGIEERNRPTADSGTFILNGGTLVAHGMAGGSGIGCKSITINGGNVTASAIREERMGSEEGQYETQDGSGYGIGSKTTDTIVVQGNAVVNATGEAQGAGIGASQTVSILGSTNVRATGGTQGAGVGDGGGNSTSPDITISDQAEVTAAGGNDAPGVGIVSVKNSCTITISGSADVTATGGDHFPGIGGNSADDGTLTIQILGNACVNTTGGNGGDIGFGPGAGIGSGASYNDVAREKNQIIIDTTGTVTATGGNDTYGESPGAAAGIGGTAGSSGGTITIKNGTIKANGGQSTWGGGAGIGGGSLGTSGTITINGGKIEAVGGKYAAAIGSGRNADVNTITIHNGDLTVTAGQYGTGIGSGWNGAAGTIDINGGTIHAQGNYGNAIGSGHAGGVGIINFNGGTTYAISSRQYGVAAIGGGRAGAECTVNITSAAAVYAFSSGLGNKSYSALPAIYDLSETSSPVVQGTFHLDHPMKNMLLSIAGMEIQSPDSSYWAFAFTVPESGEYTLTTTTDAGKMAATTGDGEDATTLLSANQLYENLYWAELDDGGQPINPEEPDPIVPDEDWMDGYTGSASYDEASNTTTITGSLTDGKFLYIIPEDAKGTVVLDGTDYIDALISKHVNDYQEFWYPGTTSSNLPIVVKNDSDIFYSYADTNFGIDDSAAAAERYHIASTLGRLGSDKDKDILRTACQPIQALYNKSSDALTTEEILHAMEKVEETYPDQFATFGEYALWYYQENYEDAKDAVSLLDLPVKYQLNLMGYASMWFDEGLRQGNMGTSLPKETADSFLSGLSEDDRDNVIAMDYTDDDGNERTSLYVMESDPNILEMGRYVAYTYGIAFTFDQSKYPITSGDSADSEENLKYLNEALGWNALKNADLSAEAIQTDNPTEAQKVIKDTVGTLALLPDSTGQIDRSQLVMPGYAIPNAMFSSAMLRGLTMDIELAPSYCVIYQGNGGLTEDDEDTVIDGYYAPGEIFTVQENMFQRDGYQFTGWTQSTNFESIDTTVGTENQQPEGNVILEAQWKKINNGGTGGGDVEPPVLDTENHYGYIVGYDDGTVRPNGKITRAEVATIFFRLLTDESRDAYWCQTNDFSDVSASDWYNNAISTLTNAGILDGYEDGTFRPNGNITRAEFATIAVRFFDLTYEGEDLFPDISDHWARDYINQAAAAGFVNGYEDGTFRPNNAITRAEAVTLVNRTLERKPHKAHLLADMIQWPDNMDQTTWYYADIQEATNSHEYYMTTSEQGEEYEIWTELLPMRDWPALEKEWSDANSSTGADVTR